MMPHSGCHYLQELIEEDATASLSQLRSMGIWPGEGFGLKLSMGTSGPCACGTGSNQKHRKRVSALSMALALFVHHSSNPQVPTILSCHCGLRPLATLCYQRLHQPIADFVRDLPPPTPTPTPATPAAVPTVDLALLSPAERLMAKARAFGAEDCCVRDPYMTVDEQNQWVLCAACNKHMNSAHVVSKKHVSYLGNIAETLHWIRNNERPGRQLVPCLRMLEDNPRSWQQNPQVSSAAPQAQQAQAAYSPPTAPQRPMTQATQAPVPPVPPRSTAPNVQYFPPPKEQAFPTEEQVLEYVIRSRDRKFGTLKQRNGGQVVVFAHVEPLIQEF
ncbi:unnamed protein product [Durusdinium trenchii]|uniref:Uncharacterized protein n=1 Tax=Durusdinium trenchii TaxID=1381693 RepID=A0ABP0S469_9DINO